MIIRGDRKKLLLSSYFCWIYSMSNLLEFLLKFYEFLRIICNWVNVLGPWPILTNMVEKMKALPLQVPRLAQGQISTT